MDGTDATGLSAALLMAVEDEVVGNAGAKFVHGGQDVSVEVLVLEDRTDALGAVR